MLFGFVLLLLHTVKAFSAPGRPSGDLASAIYLLVVLLVLRVQDDLMCLSAREAGTKGEQKRRRRAEDFAEGQMHDYTFIETHYIDFTSTGQREHCFCRQQS